MSDSDIDNTSKLNIPQLLASIGSRPVKDQEPMEAEDYNWQKSHYFTTDEMVKLNFFTENVTLNCARKFTKIYQNDFEANAISTNLYFADELGITEETQHDYYVSFGMEDEIYGMLAIPSLTAIGWITQLLDGVEPEEIVDKELSPLELSLLFDLASNLIRAFSDAHDTFSLRAKGKITQGQMPIALEPGRELCQITFEAKTIESEKPLQAHFLVFCEELLSVTGERNLTVEEIPIDVVQQAMLNHVNRTPVTATARLATAKLTFEEIVGLQPNDVLLLDQSPNKPIDLFIEDKKIIRGFPVKSDGSYAIAITELCNM